MSPRHRSLDVTSQVGGGAAQGQDPIGIQHLQASSPANGDKITCRRHSAAIVTVPTMMGHHMTGGSCLCGGITFEITGDVQGVGLCHCSLCRKASGAGSIAVSADHLTWIAGRDLVREFQRPSGYGSAFCRVCGSPAPDANRSGTLFAVPVGLLDRDSGTHVVEHIYVGSKASWDVIGDAAPQFEEHGPPERPSREQGKGK